MKTLFLSLKAAWKFKRYLIVDLLGLVFSFLCIILISQYVNYEYSVDRFNKKLDRIYVTTQEVSEQPGFRAFSGVENTYRRKTFVDLRNDPAVEKSTNFFLLKGKELTIQGNIQTADLLITDTVFFSILDFPLLSGTSDLSRPENALITESYSKKIFGKENPIGKRISLSPEEELTIAGVIKDVKSKSTISFDVILPVQLREIWGEPNTLVLLHNGSDYKEVNEKYIDFFQIRDYSMRYQLYPLSKVYFSEDILTHTFSRGNITYVRILTLVGFIILLSAIFNHINIYTAVILRRRREMVMKKVYGANRSHMFAQLYTENLLLIGVAIILAFSLVELLGPLFMNHFHLNGLNDPRFNVSLVLGLVLILPLLVTIFPFFKYSYSIPIQSLKKIGGREGKVALNKVLLTVQFVITTFLIIVSLSFLRQTHLLLNADLGYKTQNIVHVQFQKLNISHDQSREEEERLVDLVQQRMDASPLFLSWTKREGPSKYKAEIPFQYKKENGEFQDFTLLFADESWFDVFDIKLTDGRTFDNRIDVFPSANIIVSESALKMLGINDYKNERLFAARQGFWSPQDPDNPDIPYNIVGVIKDMKIGHLSKELHPVIIHYMNRFTYEPIAASIVPNRKKEALDFLSGLHDELYGGQFSYSFVEDEIKLLYEEESNMTLIYSLFTIIAILTSALGLYSLSLYDIEQYRKEIAIRKVNGATTQNIIGMLLKKYIYLILLAFVISLPIAWFFIQRYLENFAYKASMPWWIFLAALAISAIVSLATLIWHTYRAASSNPASVIKSE